MTLSEDERRSEARVHEGLSESAKPISTLRVLVQEVSEKNRVTIKRCGFSDITLTVIATLAVIAAVVATLS